MAFGISAGAYLAGGAVLASGYMSSQAAGDAADAQEAAASRSDATQRYMYDTTRQDNAPFLQNGTKANNQLALMLGLGTAGSGKTKTADDFYSELMDQWSASPSTQGSIKSNFGVWNGTAIVPDEAALRAAAERMAQQQAATGPEQANPLYGTLTKKFSLDDLSKDPVYQSGLQFGLDEGNKGIERQAAASGQMLSGATLKALAKYATDYAGTKAGESRARFVADQDSTINRINALATGAQTASSNIGSAGINAGNAISQNQLGVGNARAASAIGSANAWSGAISNGINSYQQNQLLNKLGTGGGDWWNSAAGINANGGGF